MAETIPCLRVERPGERPWYLRLERDTVLGRTPGTRLAVDDVEVSRRHALFLLRGRQTFVYDLGSRNGTFVEGRRLGLEPVRLHPGERVLAGWTSLTYVELSPAAAAGLAVERSPARLPQPHETVLGRGPLPLTRPAGTLRSA